MTEAQLCNIKIASLAKKYDKGSVKMPRTRLFAPLQMTLCWDDGVQQNVPLLYTGCSGANRDVLFTNKFAVKLQWLDPSKAKGWTPNKDEWKMAPRLWGFIPHVYGYFDVNIENRPYSALVVRKVPSTVSAFLGDLMREPLTRKLLTRVLDLLVDTVRQMCAYAGSEHKCKLADWHAENLGIDRHGVCLLDWERTEYLPKLSAYRRIKGAMKTFLAWIPQLENIPTAICDLPECRMEWMRKLEQIQAHFARWWPKFQGSDALPTPPELEALSVQLMANFASDVTTSRQGELSACPVAERRDCPRAGAERVRVEKRVYTGAKVTEAFQTVERPGERRPWMSRVSHKAREGEEGCTSQPKGDSGKKGAKVKKADLHNAEPRASRESCVKWPKVENEAGKGGRVQEEGAPAVKLTRERHQPVPWSSREFCGKRRRIEDTAEKGGRVKEEGAPAVESSRGRHQPVPMVSHRNRDVDEHSERRVKKLEKAAMPRVEDNVGKGERVKEEDAPAVGSIRASHQPVFRASRVSGAKRLRGDDTAEKGGRLKEEGAPAVESSRGRYQPVSMVSHEAREEDKQSERRVKKLEKAALTSEIRSTMEAELEQLLCEDKEADVLYARLLLREGSLKQKNLNDLVHSRGGDVFQEIFAGFFRRCSDGEVKSITAEQMFAVVETMLRNNGWLESRRSATTSGSAPPHGPPPPAPAPHPLLPPPPPPPAQPGKECCRGVSSSAAADEPYPWTPESKSCPAAKNHQLPPPPPLPMKEGCLGVPSPAAADESSAAASVKQCPWMRVKQYLSTLESQLCPAAKYQRTLERNDWRRHHTADSLGYCSLQERYVNHQWAKGHGRPKYTRKVLDEASLLLRCLHAHLRPLVVDCYEAIPPWERQYNNVTLPRSARADAENVNEHWVRPYGAKLLGEFDEAKVNISAAYAVDTAAVLEAWLWKKVSTDGQKRFLTPPYGLKRCRCDFGWPNFSITYDQLRIVIGKTMNDYNMARYIGFWEVESSART